MSTFLALLSPQVIEKLNNAGAIVHYSHNQLVHSRGDNKPGLSIVLSGTVFASIGDPDGKRLIAGILGKGHCFGEFTLFADLPRTHDISAVGPTKILQIPAKKFMPLFEQEPALASALLKATLLRMHMLLETMDAMRRLPIVPRTAKMLLTLLYSSGRSDNIACKQSELADTLGVTRVSLGKALSNLQKLNLIQVGYGKIHFPNVEIFEKWVQKACQGTLLY